jgi:hypothetical protein
MEHKVRRILLGIAVVLVAGVALAGGAFWLLMAHFYPTAPAPDYPAPRSALEAQRQDVDHFNRLLGMDRAFAQSARAEAQRRIAALMALRQALDKPHLRVALMRIAALADNGHTSVGYDDPVGTPRELPVRVAIFSDGLYVMRAADGATDLLGGRVMAVDGMPIDAVMARLETLRGGPPQWRRAYASMYLAMQDMLVGTDVARDPAASTWTVAMPSGAMVTRRLVAFLPPKDEAYVFVKRWYSSEKLKGLTKGWHALPPDAPLPIALRDFDKPFRRMRLPGACAALVQIKSNDDEAGQSLGDFLSQTAADLTVHPPCNLILDLRYDDGGNYTETARFAQNLVNFVAPRGRVFLLTGPSTFSAGLMTAAIAKANGDGRVTIIGEAPGDRLDFLAEGGRGCLPNSGLCVNFATGRHELQHPCTDIAVCFWLDWVYSMRVDTLAPDMVITQSFMDWKAGRDPSFARAEALATTSR